MFFLTSGTETDTVLPDTSGFIDFAFILAVGSGAGASDGAGAADGFGVGVSAGVVAGADDGASVGLDTLGTGLAAGDDGNVGSFGLEHAARTTIKTSPVNKPITNSFTNVPLFITTSTFGF